MLVIESRVDVEGLTGPEVTEFMLACTDEQYQRWWPGAHLQLHALGRAAGGVGDVVVMDEFIGRRRLRLLGIVEAVEPGREVVWRFRKIVPLPARLRLELLPVPGGVSVRHTITAGWSGIGRALDPLLRLYSTPRFTADLDAHVHTEFPLLRDHLRPGSAPSTEHRAPSTEHRAPSNEHCTGGTP
ncbi:hypothetical protein GCM10009767_07260 [Kocuria aegyptia]|uniref:SRPBCC family protein n=2 Tax=Kocuria aegyptia TaxID=330943 RepID=A0ABN2KAZ6_9MICC